MAAAWVMFSWFGGVSGNEMLIVAMSSLGLWLICILPIGTEYTSSALARSIEPSMDPTPASLLRLGLAPFYALSS